MSGELPPLIDLHEDLALYTYWWGMDETLAPLDQDAKDRHSDIPKFRAANVRIVFASIFTGTTGYSLRGPKTLYAPSIERVWDQLRIYTRMAKTHGFKIIASAEDAREAVEAREWRLSLLLHLEGADVVRDPEVDLELLYRLGLRSIGLTWNHSNQYASSCCDGADYGLTELGEELIKTANRLGIVIDLAHASERAAIEAARISTKPVIVSHTGLRRFVDVERNIGDEVVEAVAKTGGVVGVTLIPSLLRREGRPTVSDVAEQMTYLRDHFGIDVVAIGTDYHGIPGRSPPQGLESIDRIVNLWHELEERGFTRKEIEAIAYRNALRVLTSVLGG